MVGSNNEERRSKGPSVTAKGYSVFDGTMVDMTYVEIERAAEEKTVILLPTGVIEEHGPHLPLGVDVYGSYLIAKVTRAELNRKGIRSLIAPPFYWGDEPLYGLLCRVVYGQRGDDDQSYLGHHELTEAMGL